MVRVQRMNWTDGTEDISSSCTRSSPACPVNTAAAATPAAAAAAAAAEPTSTTQIAFY